MLLLLRAWPALRMLAIAGHCKPLQGFHRQARERDDGGTRPQLSGQP
jgi:hypothetical protein